MLKKILLGTILVSSFAFAQNEIEVNINEDSYEVSVDAYLNDYYMLNENSKYFMGFKLLGVDSDSRESKKLWSMDAKVMNQSTNGYGFNFGLGFKGLIADANKDLSAIAFGVFVQYAFDDALNLNASYHYAPEVLTFSDDKTFKEARVSLDYELVNNGFITLGYRDIETKFDDVTLNFDDCAYAGFKFKF